MGEKEEQEGRQAHQSQTHLVAALASPWQKRKRTSRRAWVNAYLPADMAGLFRGHKLTGSLRREVEKREVS